MNNINPLLSPGNLLEQRAKSKSNLIIAVFTVLAIHVVLFCGLLMQGCRQETTGSKATNAVAVDPRMLALTNLPAVTSNLVAEPPPSPPPVATPSNPPPVTPAVADTGGVASNPPAANPPVADTGGAPANPPPGNPPPANPPVVEPGGSKEYTVAKGDYFLKIAKAHGITVADMTKANPNVDSRKLKIGQKLVIPAPSAAPEGGKTEGGKTEGAGGAKAEAGGVTTYTVKANDNLTKIARLHHTTAKEIQALNKLPFNQLRVGQKLKIPAPKTGSSATPAASGAKTNSGAKK